MNDDLERTARDAMDRKSALQELLPPGSAYRLSAEELVERADVWADEHARPETRRLVQLLGEALRKEREARATSATIISEGNRSYGILENEKLRLEGEVHRLEDAIADLRRTPIERARVQLAAHLRARVEKWLG
jgi:hypothetical protein